jgi:hypothetical protein
MASAAGAGMNVIESYLVKLGSSIDVGSFNKFQSTLTQANNQVASMTSGAVKDFIKLEGAILGTFTAIGGGLITMADHAAMADQSYRLLGMRMLMSKDAARSMQMALDTLGITLDEATYDEESNKRFIDLMERNRKMGEALGPLFDKDMRGIRDIRTEIKQFGTELDFLMYGTVDKLYQKLGFGSGDALADIKRLSNQFADDIPMWADKMSTVLMPVWTDFTKIMYGLKDDASSAGLAFTNIVGTLTGDQSIKGTTFDVEKLGKALDHVADGLTNVTVLSEKAFKWVVDKLPGAVDKTKGFLDKLYASQFGGEQLVTPGQVWDATKGASKSVFNWSKRTNWKDYFNPFYAGPTGTNMGGPSLPQLDLNSITTSGDLLPLIRQSQAGGGGTAATSIDFHGLLSKKAVDKQTLSDMINKAAQETGLDPRLIAAVMTVESHGDPGIVNPDSGATGLMQLMPGTAKRYGVADMTDPWSNLEAGSKELARFINLNQGDLGKGLGGFGGFVTKDPEGYIAKVVDAYRQEGGGEMEKQVNIQNFTIQMPPGSPDQNVQFVQDVLKKLQRDSVVRLGQAMGGPFG